MNREYIFLYVSDLYEAMPCGDWWWVDVHHRCPMRGKSSNLPMSLKQINSDDYISSMHSHCRIFYFVLVWLEPRTLLLILAPIFQVLSVMAVYSYKPLLYFKIHSTGLKAYYLCVYAQDNQSINVYDDVFRAANLFLSIVTKQKVAYLPFVTLLRDASQIRSVLI